MPILTILHSTAVQLLTHPPALLGLGLKASLLLLAVAALAVVLRRASAATRHLLWAGAMAVLLALPLLGPLLPTWSLPITRAPQQATATPNPAPARGSAAVGTPLSQATALPLPGTAMNPLPSPGSTTLDLVRSDRGPTAREHRPAAFAWAAGARRWITPLWLAGLLAVAARLLTDWAGLRRLARQAQPVDEHAWHRTLDALTGELALARPVTLLRSCDRTTPMTWGVLRPVILVPAASAGWSSERREAVLLHELAHVRRRDWLVQLVTEAACAIHWFNPLVWMGAHQVRAERERACDDQVLNHGTRPCDYATHLLEIARMTHHRSSLLSATIAMARRSRLERRLRAILDPSLPRDPARRPQRLMLGCFIAAFALGLGSWQPWALAEDDDKPARSVSRSTETRIEVRSSATAQSGAGPATNIPAIELSWSGDDGRTLRLRMEGKVDLTDDQTAIARIAPGGHLTLQEKTDAGERCYEAKAGEEGGIDVEWTVDGAPAEFDADAQAWLTRVLTELRPFFSERPGTLATLGAWIGAAAHVEPFSADPFATGSPTDDEGAATEGEPSGISIEAERIVVDRDAGAVQAEGDVTIRIESTSDSENPSVVMYRSERRRRDGSAPRDKPGATEGIDRDEASQWRWAQLAERNAEEMRERMSRLAEENAERLARQLESRTRSLEELLDQHRRQLDRLGEDVSRRQADLLKLLESADQQLSKKSIEQMLQRQQESLGRLLEAQSRLLRTLSENTTGRLDPFLDELEQQVPRGLDSLQRLLEGQHERIGWILEKEEGLLDLLRRTMPELEEGLRELLPTAGEEAVPAPAKDEPSSPPPPGE